jgi:hypothetical protein
MLGSALSDYPLLVGEILRFREPQALGGLDDRYRLLALGEDGPVLGRFLRPDHFPVVAEHLEASPFTPLLPFSSSQYSVTFEV